MAETEQVPESSSNDEESPEPQTSGSRRRFKASNMSFVEMVEMVDIFKRANYDGKHGPYPNLNLTKAKIMTKVVKSLPKNFGVRRSKDHLRKHWSNLKLREQDQYRRIKRVLQKREKRPGMSEVTRDPQPPKEGELTTPRPPDVEEGEVYEVGEIVTTAGDVDVEEETHFTSANAHVLIGEIMVCNRDLQKIKEDYNDLEKRLKNIIDVLGRIENTPTFIKFFLFF
ncbi:hypothetical protein AB205_0142760 [Aquarana catesbeiana]|uniref:Myb/SANT-like DNA-binding domain-containing protein n=1 Tax=Aquarana catesbeiana TaxID=8400 RepID=A0A2G9RYK5_AQUCT|nr:hypothetical protein AB205_0142760 [Aquarana catesbeiana]